MEIDNIRVWNLPRNILVKGRAIITEVRAVSGGRVVISLHRLFQAPTAIISQVETQTILRRLKTLRAIVFAGFIVDIHLRRMVQIYQALVKAIG